MKGSHKLSTKICYPLLHAANTASVNISASHMRPVSENLDVLPLPRRCLHCLALHPTISQQVRQDWHEQKSYIIVCMRNKK